MAATVIRNFIAKALFKKKGAIANNKAVDFSANALEQRLRRVGIDPNAIRSEQELNQILAAVKQAEDQAFQQRFGDMLGGSKFDRKGEVFDMSGKKLDSSRGIMGGTQVDEKSLKEGLMKTDNPFSDLVKTTEKGPKTLKEREAEVLARMNRENKKGIEGLKQKMKKEQARTKRISGNLRADNLNRYEIGKPKLDEDEYNYYRELLDDEENFVVKGDETLEQLDAMVKESEDEIAYMKRLYDKGALDPPEDMAQGGRAGYKFGLGPLLKSMNKTSPQQAYKKYLQSVKDRAKKGDMKSLAPELSAVAASGIFINRRMQDVLKNMKEKDMENSLKNFRKELNSDPFYNKYPELKDKVLENYTEKMFGEKRADGGRIGFKDGMDRRSFLKIMGGLAAIPVVGKFFKFAKTAKGIKSVPIVETPNAPGKPEWFDALVTRVIREGDDVTKTMATKDRQNVYRKKIDDETEVMVTQDLDEGITRIDIDDATRNVTGFDDPPTVSLQVTDEIVEEGGVRTKPKFEATENDYRNYATDPDGGYDTEFVENTVENTKDLTSDLTKVKSFATKKKPTMKEIVESKKRKDNVKYAQENPSSYAADRGPDYDPSDYIDDMADDFASGGIARMLGE